MIQLMRKKGLSIGAIKDLLEVFKNGDKPYDEEALQVAIKTEVEPPNVDQTKALVTLEIFQGAIRQLPEQIKNMVEQELQTALSEHQKQVTEQINEILGTRLEKFQKKKKRWWRF